MTEFFEPAAETALRYEIFSSPKPLGHPDLGNDPTASAKAINQLLDSEHPDDRLAVISIKGLFRINDSPYAPETLPDLEAMHRNVLEWMTGLDAESLNKFLRWNVTRQAHYQERLRADIFDLQAEVLGQTAALADYGLFNPGAPANMEMALNLTTYAAWDSFGAGGFMGAGLYAPEAKLMLLRNYYSGGEQGLERMSPYGRKVHTHESIHGLRFFINGGLGTILPEANDPASTQWVDEAFTEHAAQVALSGDPSTMDPAARLAANAGSSIDERQLVAGINRASRPEIGMELWAEAFAEPLNASRQPARRELHQRLGALSARVVPELSGRNIAHAIGAELARASAVRRPAIINRWLTKVS